MSSNERKKGKGKKSALSATKKNAKTRVSSCSPLVVHNVCAGTWLAEYYPKCRLFGAMVADARSTGGDSDETCRVVWYGVRSCEHYMGENSGVHMQLQS